ncbi:hypothetical protein E2C01_094240 [Portunus trituberculatus]|uniref:Uncharacterized protein n=1 Tax=Portunus trituberculatus TaxID=210409 RepID=A0A5B7JWC8_PORTR|nr:hypothetical protein [Portunus trituberculatus]
MYSLEGRVQRRAGTLTLEVREREGGDEEARLLSLGIPEAFNLAGSKRADVRDVCRKQEIYYAPDILFPPACELREVSYATCDCYDLCSSLIKWSGATSGSNFEKARLI